MAKFFKNFGWPILCGLLLAVAFLSWNQTRQLQSLLQSPALVSGYLSNIEASHGDEEADNRSGNGLNGYSAAVGIAKPSVVKIFTARLVDVQRHPLFNDPLVNQLLRNRQQPRQRLERGLGSGVIVDADGLILTNYHVIRNADQIQVMLDDGRQRIAKLIGRDEATDLALLAIDLDNLPAAKFADIDSVAIGDIVLAIGNPYGIGQTVTQGIVSALNRHGLHRNTYESYIQTDAAINQGNSGGALINAEGELIGINSSFYSRTGASNGIGFAIPIDVAQFVLQHLLDYGRVKRGWLGVSAEELTPLLAEQFGLSIDSGLVLTSVASGGPAERAGLMPGDIITHISEQAVGSGNTGMHVIAQSPPGEAIGIRVLRGSAAMSLAIVLDEKPAAISESRARTD